MGLVVHKIMENTSTSKKYLLRVFYFKCENELEIIFAIKLQKLEILEKYNKMKINYDPKADALYIKLTE